MIIRTHTHVLPDGSQHVIEASGVYTVENNCELYRVVYTVAGETRTKDYHAPKALWYSHRYAPSLERAVDNVILMTCRCLSNAYDKTLLQRKPESAEARCSVIADKLRYEYRHLIYSMYPSNLENRIRIECLAANVPALQDIIDGIMDGHDDVTIEWKSIEAPVPFTGIIVSSTQENAA